MHEQFSDITLPAGRYVTSFRSERVQTSLEQRFQDGHRCRKAQTEEPSMSLKSSFATRTQDAS